MQKFLHLHIMSLPPPLSLFLAFSIIDHILTLHCLVKQEKVRKNRYGYFVDSRTSFHTTQRKHLLQKSMCSNFHDMMWVIYALYEQVLGQVRCHGG